MLPLIIITRTGLPTKSICYAADDCSISGGSTITSPWTSFQKLKISGKGKDAFIKHFREGLGLAARSDSPTLSTSHITDEQVIFYASVIFDPRNRAYAQQLIELNTLNGNKSLDILEESDEMYPGNIFSPSSSTDSSSVVVNCDIKTLPRRLELIAKLFNEAANHPDTVFAKEFKVNAPSAKEMDLSEALELDADPHFACLVSSFTDLVSKILLTDPLTQPIMHAIYVDLAVSLKPPFISCLDNDQFNRIFELMLQHLHPIDEDHYGLGKLGEQPSFIIRLDENQFNRLIQQILRDPNIELAGTVGGNPRLLLP